MEKDTQHICILLSIKKIADPLNESDVVEVLYSTEKNLYL